MKCVGSGPSTTFRAVLSQPKDTFSRSRTNPAKA